MEEKYKWNLQEIFKDFQEFEEKKQSFKKHITEIKKYEGQLCKSSNNLYNCYYIYEKMLEELENLYAYGMLNYDLDIADQKNTKLFKEVEELDVDFEKATAFITSELIYEDPEKIRQYLEENANLKRYERIINKTLENRKHILSKEEEKLLANYFGVFSAPKNIFKILTNTEFKFDEIVDEKNQKLKLSETNYTKYLKSHDENVRKQAFNKLYQKYKDFIKTISETYLSNVKITSINAKVRNYESSLEQALEKDETNTKVYNSLIESVNKNLKYNHEFVELKKKMLNKEDFHMYDLYVNPFKIEKDEITFEEAKTEVLEALEVMGKEYNENLNKAFENSWIDAFTGENKRRGAYSMGVYGVHPYILLNFVHTKKDISTLAHELGHSMHSYYSNSNQNVIESDYTILVGEVASTVNEILLSEYEIKNEKDKLRKAELIYELLETIRTTFFRQSMFAEFEMIVHEKIDNKQMLSTEDLNEIYYDLNKKYFGKDIVVDKEIQYEWARIPHFYRDFYVYKYSTGISAAISIAKNIMLQGEEFVNKYIEMLKQGCSKKSINLLKIVNVDLENMEVYQATADFYKEKLDDLKEILEVYNKNN